MVYFFLQTIFMSIGVALSVSSFVVVFPLWFSPFVFGSPPLSLIRSIFDSFCLLFVPSLDRSIFGSFRLLFVPSFVCSLFSSFCLWIIPSLVRSVFGLFRLWFVLSLDHSIFCLFRLWLVPSLVCSVFGSFRLCLFHLLFVPSHLSIQGPHERHYVTKYIRHCVNSCCQEIHSIL